MHIFIGMHNIYYMWTHTVHMYMHSDKWEDGLENGIDTISVLSGLTHFYDFDDLMICSAP